MGMESRALPTGSQSQSLKQPFDIKARCASVCTQVHVHPLPFPKADGKKK